MHTDFVGADLLVSRTRGSASLPSQYTSTNTAVACADFTTSSNFSSTVFGS